MGSVSGAGSKSERQRIDETDQGPPPAPVSAATLSAPYFKGSLFKPQDIKPNDPLLAEAVRNATKEVAPFGLADLSLYTDDALEREIDAARVRVANGKGRCPEGELAAIGRAEAELLRRKTPKIVPVSSLTTRESLEAAIKEQEGFLTRFGARLAPPVRAEHQRYVDALKSKLEGRNLTERACDTARPTFVSGDHLPGGAREIALSADDFVATLEKSIPLSAAQKQQVKAIFEQWRQQTCLRTGEDPTRFANQNTYAEAKIDRKAHDVENARKCLELIEAVRDSAFAAAAFLDSAARGESLDGALARVRAATTVGDVAMALPAAPGVVRAESPRAEARKVEGLADKQIDERLGRGHAVNTRFRGVDNSAFEKDPRLVTYGPYRKNPAGAVRSLEQARAIYEKQTGRPIPPWVKIVVDDKLPPDRDAMYVFKNQGKLGTEITHRELTNGVVVRIRPDVLASDESIVGHLRHELWELEALATKLESGSMTGGDLRTHTEAKRPSVRNGESLAPNLHNQAWDVADLEVRLMRETPGSPKHREMRKLYNMLVSRFMAQNAE